MAIPDRGGEDEMGETVVRDVMTAAVVTVVPEDSIREAARRMLGNRIGGMPVVAGRRVVGVVSEGDIIDALTPADDRERGRTVLDLVMAGREPAPSRPRCVEDIMSKWVVAVPPTATIWEAASTMHRRGIKRLPVTDDEGRLVGIITVADLIRAVAVEGA
jgi:CBS domain-containing protein